jgi:hypothetical protein
MPPDTTHPSPPLSSPTSASPTLPDAAEAHRSGEAAFELVKGQIDAELQAAALNPQPKPAALPATDPGKVALSLLGLLSALQPHDEGARARFSAPEAARALTPFFEQGRTWALATVFVAANYAKSPTPEGALLKLSAQGKPLRKRAFEIVRFLESVGLVEAGTTAKLRAGTGYRDLASDCTLSALHIRAHWGSISALLAQQAADPFTADHLRQLTDIGDAMTLEVARDDGLLPTPWRSELLACISRLEALYTPWREAMRYHLDALGRHEAAWLRPFLSLGRSQ